MMKTLTPTGGVIRLISITRVMMIPNQIGSNPISITIGKTIGMVSTMIARPSIKQPKTIYAKISIAMTTYLFSPSSPIQVES